MLTERLVMRSNATAFTHTRAVAGATVVDETAVDVGVSSEHRSVSEAEDGEHLFLEVVDQQLPLRRRLRAELGAALLARRPAA